MANRLIDEKSPYLLQHAHNPVDWLPWGEEAFDKARRENKPVFLSIGYSTCHWCHVMERESFMDPEVAALLNRTMVPVKVDREERPDLDSLYMAFCQAMAGRGGWPLTVILTPDKKPFFAGTYFPKNGMVGRAGLMDVITRIDEIWRTRRKDAQQAAESVLERVREFAAQAGEAGPETEIGPGTLSRATEKLAQDFDREHGGFGDAPKFPSPHVLLFLLREHERTGDPLPLDMVEMTLAAMARGGIQDHVGFGFHRYSTDATWLVPHFEKMLYDQAMLAMAYVEAAQATGNQNFKETALRILDYLDRDMSAPEGGFYSAEDADSEGHEGKFYVWTEREVRELLPKDEAALFCKAYGFSPQGNYHDEASRVRTGANISHLPKPLGVLADELGLEPETLRARLETCRQTLFAAREKRLRPFKDDKILTDWNGLVIAALAKAARAFDRPDLAERAMRAADFLLRQLRDDAGRLLHRRRDGQSGLRAHLDDYAFLLWGLTELAQAAVEPRFLKAALELASDMITHFEDPDQGGFFLTASDAEELLLRQKDLFDAALPSGNSVAAHALLRLARLSGRADLEAAARKTIQAFVGAVAAFPSGFCMFLCAAAFAQAQTSEIVIVGDPDDPATKALRQAADAAFLPNAVVLVRPAKDAGALAEAAPFVKNMTLLDGQPAAYVCAAGACQRPVTDPARMLELAGG